jgi:4-aminobutyrate aminotransferase
MDEAMDASNSTPDWRLRSKNCARILRFPDIVSAECHGVYIKDIDGNVYIDFTAGAHTVNVGHNHPKIIKAVNQQMQRTGTASMNWVANPSRILLAEKLKQIAPGQLKKGQVGFCNTGSDGAEISLRLAQIYTERSRVLCCFGCSHGQTSMGASALNTSPRRRSGFPLVPGIAYVPFPYCYRCIWGQNNQDCDLHCLNLLEYELDTEVVPPQEVAAFFLEPIQLHGGIVVPPDQYIQRIRKLCDKYGILLIVDEVATGFGRTGKMFGIEHSNVDPDIIYMAKSIAAGLPLGAVIASEAIMADFIGGGTFSGHSVACAAALANIDILQQEKLIENAEKMGRLMMRRLAEMSNRHEFIGDVRGGGLLVGVELVEDRDKKTPAVDATKQFIRKAKRKGLLIFPAGVYDNVLRIYPPLSINEMQVNEALGIMDECFSQVEN